MLRSAVLFLAACAASAVLAAPSGHHPLLSKRTSPTEPPPVIDLGYARVQGYLNSTDSQYWWKGIRYASADRFQAPRTPATHTAAVYNASAYGPICFQASEGAVTLQGKPPVANFTIANQSEDCLYLNINAPAGACEGSNLPVLVWIHGGGELFSASFASESFTDARIVSSLSRLCGRLGGSRQRLCRVHHQCRGGHCRRHDPVPPRTVRVPRRARNRRLWCAQRRSAGPGTSADPRMLSKPDDPIC
jgi:hypothetical protein